MRKNKNIEKHGFKKMKCKYCKHTSNKVDKRTTADTCWKCTSKYVDGQIMELSK